jgi:hypothetical protein
MAALETNYKPAWTSPHFRRLVQIARDGTLSEFAGEERWQHERTLSSAFATTASPKAGHSVRHKEHQAMALIPDLALELRQTQDDPYVWSLVSEKDENPSLVTETSSSDRSYIIPDACLLIYRKSHVPIALDQRRETRLHYTQVRSQDPSRYAACIGQRSEECFPSRRRSAYIHRSSPPLYTNSHQSWTSAARRISIHGCSAR